MQDLSHTRQWSGSPIHPPSLSWESVLISYTLPVVSTSFSASGSAPGLLLCHGEELLGYLHLYIKTLPDSSGRGRGQQRCGPGGPEPLSWPRVTSQPALRQLRLRVGARASPLGRWGKVETTLTHLWTSQWRMPGKIGDTCPQARLRGLLYMCWQPHPCLPFSTEPLGASFYTEGGARWPQTLGIQDPFG